MKNENGETTKRTATIIGTPPAFIVKMFTEAVCGHYSDLPEVTLRWGAKSGAGAHYAAYGQTGREIVVGDTVEDLGSGWCEIVLIHELSHWVAEATGEALDSNHHRGVGNHNCNSSADGHCVGFWRTYFGEVAPKLMKNVTWKQILTSEFSYKPRNAYKVARELNIKEAKAAYKNRSVYPRQSNNHHRAKVGRTITSKTELEWRLNHGYTVKPNHVDSEATYCDRKEDYIHWVYEIAINLGAFTEDEWVDHLHRLENPQVIGWDGIIRIPARRS